MDTKAALRVASGLRSHFEAFKHLEELLEYLAQTENLHAELEKSLAGLQAAIARDEKAHRGMLADFGNERQAVRDEINALRTTLRTESESAALERDTTRSAFEREMSALAAASHSQRSSIESSILDLNARKASLEKELADLTKQVEKLKSRITSI